MVFRLSWLYKGNMNPIHDGEFSYTIEAKRFKSGQLAWIWEVRKTRDGWIVERGASVRSHEAAAMAALATISRARVAAREQAPAPW